jgi:thiol-disulfide isomerase/thioredoxin
MFLRYFLLTLTVFCFSFIQKANQALVSKTFPDFSFQGMFEKNAQLSQLKGSFVLVNFWASWNEESRKMQLKQAPVYSRFKDQTFKQANGFEIVSVSIDTEISEYQLALKKDRLNWANYACDSMGWKGKLVQSIKLKGIPSNFLLDSNGIVIAENIDSDSLETTLLQLQ